MFKPEEVFKAVVPDFLIFFFLMSKSASLAFTNSGAKEKNGMLLNHRGIVNVNINNNTFKNNKVQFVSILWVSPKDYL